MKNRERGRGGNLLHFTRPAIVPRTMPCALQRSILEQIAQRHRKMLVGADIAQRGYLAFIADEANGIATRAHALEDRSLGQIG